MMKSGELILTVTMCVMFFTSVILGASTLWHVIRKAYFFWVTDLGVELASWVMTLARSVLCLAACWLAHGAVRRPRPAVYIALLILLSSGMLMFSAGVGGAAGLARAATPAALEASMLSSLQATEKKPSLVPWFDLMHRDMAQSCTEPRYPRGCLTPALAELQAFLVASVSYSSCLIVMMAAALLVGSCLVVTAAEVAHRPQLMSLSALPSAPPPAANYFPLPPHASPTPSLL